MLNGSVWDRVRATVTQWLADDDEVYTDVDDTPLCSHCGAPRRAGWPVCMHEEYSERGCLMLFEQDEALLRYPITNVMVPNQLVEQGIQAPKITVDAADAQPDPLLEALHGGTYKLYWYWTDQPDHLALCFQTLFPTQLHAIVFDLRQPDEFAIVGSMLRQNCLTVFFYTSNESTALRIDVPAVAQHKDYQPICNFVDRLMSDWHAWYAEQPAERTGCYRLHPWRSGTDQEAVCLQPVAPIAVTGATRPLRL